MTDLELTKLCAEAMTYPRGSWKSEGQDGLHFTSFIYNPLTDDAQAMALVKQFTLHILFNSIDGWRVGISGDGWKQDATFDLNRAICWCVAKMQLAKRETDKIYRHGDNLQTGADSFIQFITKSKT